MLYSDVQKTNNTYRFDMVFNKKVMKNRGDTIMKEKVVLAYSGGLDTTAVIPWLKENYDYDVVCCCVNVGQGNEIDGLQERAKLSGAEKLYILDVVDEFCDEYVAPCVQANATYENEYLLGTSMARPLIAKKLVEIARKEGAVAVCHGATGKGNDQVRFELAFKALAPDLKIIAPWRCNETWNMKSREDEIEYCKKHGINLPFSSVDNSYSRDRNLWHISHEGEKGIPVALNGKEMKYSEIVTELNKIGGANGIGIVDIVENRVVGMKSRGVYETPGGTILMAAHKQLEELILDRDSMAFKKTVDNRFADIVYEGKWFTPLCDSLRAYIKASQEYVTGTANLKLYKGNIIKQGTTSPYSLYNESIASFATGDMYDHHDAEGFINLFGLSLKVRAMKLAEAEKKK